MRQHKIAALIDGSEFSLLILHYIKAFFSPTTCTVILLCVVKEPASLPVDGLLPEQSSRDFIEATRGVKQQIEADLAPHQRSLEDAGFTVSVEVLCGDPIEEIDTFIDLAQVDLIAMTTHGRTGLRRVLLGSVAQHFLQKAAIPLLLYRPFGYE